VNTLVRILLLAFACSSGNLFGDHVSGEDPVSLVEDTTVHIFADVAENLEEYTANPARRCKHWFAKT